MPPDPWAALRKLRYALPEWVERTVAGPGPAAAAGTCEALHRRGVSATVGYFQAGTASPETIVAANRAVAACLSQRSGDAYLSVKAPPLGFDEAHLREIARAAAAAGMDLVFDAHAPNQAEPTLALVRALAPEHPRTGCVLPARWSRSLADAERFRDTAARIRVVKGEWAETGSPERDLAPDYLALVSRLAGRAAPVAIATHDPSLAERALGLLLAAGTPCELEQLRGLPNRRTTAVAKRLGVRVRVYVPFGPGWWPYALDKSLARPYLLSWALRDRFAAA